MLAPAPAARVLARETPVPQGVRDVVVPPPPLTLSALPQFTPPRAAVPTCRCLWLHALTRPSYRAMASSLSCPHERWNPCCSCLFSAVPDDVMQHN
ncbi:hypothetical protein EON68_04625, partial [archaeon]